MQVVKYGKRKPCIQTCKQCGAVLEYTDVDVDENVAIKCPVCGRYQIATLERMINKDN